MEYKPNKTLYDYSIEYDISHLPKGLQDSIKELEEYDKIGDWLSYDLKFEVLEVDTKYCYRNHKITEHDFKMIMRKYGWYND